MNRIEVAQILAIAKQFDKYIAVDDLSTNAWYMMLEKVHYNPALDRVKAFYANWDGRTQLSPKIILSGQRTEVDAAADVRSARARKLIPRDWPESDPLPPDVQQKLDDARAEYMGWLDKNPWAISA